MYLGPTEHYVNLFQVLNKLFNSYMYCKVHVISNRPEVLNEAWFISIFTCCLLVHKLESNHLI